MLIVILGDKGSLGSVLSLFFSEKHNVVGIDLDKLDLSRYDDYEEELKKLFDFDLSKTVIINCVGIMGAKESEVDPSKYYEINGVLPYKLKQFFASNIKNHLFIQISSETVYGKCKYDNQIFSEDDLCLPQHNYGLSKLISEQLLKSADNTRGATIILRTPVLLFKAQKYPNALSQIYDEINTKGSATLFGNGEHKRQYTIAEEFAMDLEKLLDNWITNPKKFAQCEMINMPGIAISTKEFTDVLAKSHNLEFEVLLRDNASSAFSLLSSSNKFSKICNTIRIHGSVKHLVEWVVENNG